MHTVRLTEEMFSSGKPFAQGEVLIWMKKYAPQSVLSGLAKLKLQPLSLEGEQFILGHSESGHNHVLESATKEVPLSRAAQALIDGANDTFVELKLFHDCMLVHQRPYDQHVAVVLPPGEYIRGIREEQTVQGWVRVRD